MFLEYGMLEASNRNSSFTFCIIRQQTKAKQGRRTWKITWQIKSYGNSEHFRYAILFSSYADKIVPYKSNYQLFRDGTLSLERCLVCYHFFLSHPQRMLESDCCVCLGKETLHVFSLVALQSPHLVCTHCESGLACFPPMECVWILDAFARTSIEPFWQFLILYHHCGFSRPQRDSSIVEGKLIVVLLYSRYLDVSV